MFTEESIDLIKSYLEKKIEILGRPYYEEMPTDVQQLDMKIEELWKSRD